MPWIVIVAGLALVQFIVFGILVGAARGRYKVEAPATTGHDMFDRYYRVHYNTMEQLVVFLPALFLSAAWGFGPDWVTAAIGAVFLVGRQLYFSAYVRDPKSRSLGFALSVLPGAALLLNAIAGAVAALR